MKCHESSSALTEKNGSSNSLILVGNPNVGKSVIFGYLTGKYVTVSNYPGTTVELVSGVAKFGDKKYNVIDTPGTNNLIPMSEDEEVTRNILLKDSCKAVIHVYDSKNLDRGLLLGIQLAEMNVPIVSVLNMQDEVLARGIKIDHQKLSDILRIPVHTATATQQKGLAAMRRSLENPGMSSLIVDYGKPIEDACKEIERVLPDSHISKRSIAMMILAGDRTLNQYLQHNLEGQISYINKIREEAQSNYKKPMMQIITEARLKKVEEIMREVFISEKQEITSIGELLGRLSTHRVGGYFILAAILYGVYWFVGLLGAGVLVDFFETVLFDQYLNQWSIKLFDFIFPFPHNSIKEISEYALNIPITSGTGIETGIVISREVMTGTYTIPPGVELSFFQKVIQFFYDFFVGEYGVITMALTYGFAIVLPIVGTFFIAFSLLEDSGYLPRLAAMVNKAFKAIGLNGKAVLPMLLGFGCDTMATMTARIMETKKERIIVTLLLALGIPCSAQLGVLLAMMASISVTGVIIWSFTVIGVLILVGYLSSMILKGDSTSFLLELPPIRKPIMKNILIKTFARMEWYLKEVIPLFVLGTAVLFFMDRLELLEVFRRWGSPLVQDFLGLPPMATEAFLIGFLRRDYGAVYLLDAANQGLMTPLQILISMVTITLFVPCIANVFVIAKERGFKTCFYMVAFIFPFAFLVGGILNLILRFFQVTI